MSVTMRDIILLRVIPAALKGLSGVKMFLMLWTLWGPTAVFS